MMKKFLIMLVVLTGLSACDEKNYYVEVLVNRPPEEFRLTEDYPVEFKDGYISVVTVGEDTVFMGNSNLIEAVVPKVYGITRSSDIRCSLIPDFKASKDNPDYVFSTASHTARIMFEDSPGGDSDYNDFVCQMVYRMTLELSKDTQEGRKGVITFNNFDCTPQAVGATKPLAFGFVFFDSVTGDVLYDELLYKNVITDCYTGVSGFVNTEPGKKTNSKSNKKILTGKTYELSLENPLGIGWYIESDGQRFYTADAAKYLGTNAAITEDNIVKLDKMPFGIYTIGNKPTWMYEEMPIWAGYPNFRAWLSGENVNPFGVKGRGIYEFKFF